MIAPKTLAEAFARNVDIIKRQAEGLSQADSLIQLPFRANCMNWVLGHLVNNRQSVLKLLGAELAIDAGRLSHYTHGSEPVLADGPDVLPLDQLLAFLEESQEQITSLLEQVTPQALEKPVVVFGDRSQSVADWLFFFYFHDCYHTGQTEILRQAAGKNDKII